MKKTLFHLVDSLNMGGTESMLRRLIPELEKKFHNIVICLKGEGDIDFKNSKIKVYYLHHRNLLSFPRTFWEFRGLVKKYCPEILNTYLPIPDIFGRVVGKIFRIPRII